MRAFVDTSALYALLDEDDDNHASARAWFTSEASDPSTLLATHAYVIVESCGLVQRRLGADAVRVLLDALVPTLSVLYVNRNCTREQQQQLTQQLSSNAGSRLSIA